MKNKTYENFFSMKEVDNSPLEACFTSFRRRQRVEGSSTHAQDWSYSVPFLFIVIKIILKFISSFISFCFEVYFFKNKNPLHILSMMFGNYEEVESHLFALKSCQTCYTPCERLARTHSPIFYLLVPKQLLHVEFVQRILQ